MFIKFYLLCFILCGLKSNEACANSPIQNNEGDELLIKTVLKNNTEGIRSLIKQLEMGEHPLPRAATFTWSIFAYADRGNSDALCEILKFGQTAYPNTCFSDDFIDSTFNEAKFNLKCLEVLFTYVDLRFLPEPSANVKDSILKNAENSIRESLERLALSSNIISKIKPNYQNIEIKLQLPNLPET